MTLSNSWMAYKDCFDLFERAIESPKGIRFRVGDRGAALHFRLRLHIARRIDRARNVEIYPPGDPMHNVSEFDTLIVTIEGSGKDYWIRIEPHGAEALDIQEIAAE